MASNALVRLLGWSAILLQGDLPFLDRVRWLRRRLKPGPLRTLDAGCGSGAMTILAARLGNKALGLAFDAEAVATAKSRAEILKVRSAAFEVVDLRQLDQHLDRLGQFDQIIALEVIEHLLDDNKLLANLARMLVPGGQLFLSTPYLHHVPVYRELEHVSGIEDGRHVRFGYTHEGLANQLHAVGLQVMERSFLSGWVVQKLFSLYLRLGRWHPKLGWFLTLPLRPLSWFDEPLTRWLKYPYFCVALVAQKPTAPSSAK